MSDISSDGIEEFIRESAEDGDPIADEQTEEQQPPAYRIIADRIPVSRHHGSVWQSRKQAAKKRMDTVRPAWDEAERYYNHDQRGHRSEGQGEQSGNQGANQHIGPQWSETENIVFSNIQSLMPLIYAKNPHVEFTSTKKEHEEVTQSLQRLANALITMRFKPGVDLKPRARRAVMSGLLKNAGWIKIGFTRRDVSRENALQELQQITQELAEADSPEDIQRLEGQLEAIERDVQLNQPWGLTCEFVHPENLLVDPDATEPDLSDASFVMECDYLPTEYLKARYGQREDEGSTVKLAYKPTHVMAAGEQGPGSSEHSDLGTMLKLDVGSDGSSLGHEDYGFEDEAAFREAQHTKVWYCWDKTTKRVYMFLDNDWTWPLWVWSDPYGLHEFFPYYNMAFHPPLRGVYAKGEVTYYQDQQDAINDINSMQSRVLAWANNKMIYNKNVLDENTATKLLTGPDGTAAGVAVDPQTDLRSAITAWPPPNAEFMQQFSKQEKLSAITRVSGVREVMQGNEFKTNTTNDAISTYNSLMQTRLDEKIDSVERVIGHTAFGLVQLALRFLETAEIERIVGEQDAQNIAQVDHEQLRSEITMNVVGGSTRKPSAAYKKEEAMGLAQALGQFANASPAVVEVMLQVLEQAFDEVVLKEEDWQRIRDSVAAAQQRAGSGPGGEGEQPSAEGEAASAAGNGADAQQLSEDARAALEQLPPQQRDQVLQAAEQTGQSVEQVLLSMSQQGR